MEVILLWIENHPNVALTVGGGIITGFGTTIAWLATRNTDVIKFQNDAWGNLVRMYQTTVDGLTHRVEECEEDRVNLWEEVRKLRMELQNLKSS